MKRILTALFLTAGVGAILACSVRAMDGEPPAMFRGNPQHTGSFDSPPVNPARIKWRYRTGGKVRSTPAVWAGTVFAGSEDGHLYALDAATGTLKWKYETGGEVTSSPAVADNVVYFGGGDRNFHAVDARTGKRAWLFKAGPDVPWTQMPGDPRNWDYYVSSPVLANGFIYWGSGDANVYALDQATGAKQWAFRTGGRVRATPAVYNGVVYAGSSDGHLYALDAATGALKWKFKCEGNKYFPVGEVQSSPAVADGTVFFGSRDGHLYAVDIETGQKKWTTDHEGSWVITSPAVAGGIVYAGSSDGMFLQAVDARTGKEKWRFAEFKARFFASPAVVGDLVYGANMGGYVLGIDRATGKVRFGTVVEGEVNSSPVFVNGVMYFGCDDSHIYAMADK